MEEISIVKRRSRLWPALLLILLLVVIVLAALWFFGDRTATVSWNDIIESGRFISGTA